MHKYSVYQCIEVAVCTNPSSAGYSPAKKIVPEATPAGYKWRRDVYL